MKAAYVWLAVMALVSGCVNAPEAWVGGKPPPVPAQVQPPEASAKAVQADDVTEANASAVARALRKEMDREEQKIRSEG